MCNISINNLTIVIRWESNPNIVVVIIWIRNYCQYSINFFYGMETGQSGTSKAAFSFRLILGSSIIVRSVLLIILINKRSKDFWNIHTQKCKIKWIPVYCLILWSNEFIQLLLSVAIITNNIICLKMLVNKHALV